MNFKDDQARMMFYYRELLNNSKIKFKLVTYDDALMIDPRFNPSFSIRKGYYKTTVEDETIVIGVTYDNFFNKAYWDYHNLDNPTKTLKVIINEPSTFIQEYTKHIQDKLSNIN